jgi:hypothetical protein
VLLRNEKDTKAFNQKYEGPFEVVCALNSNLNYEIKPVKKNGRKKVVHANRLRRYVARDIVVKPEPIEATLEDLFEPTVVDLTSGQQADDLPVVETPQQERKRGRKKKRVTVEPVQTDRGMRSDYAQTRLKSRPVA